MKQSSAINKLSGKIKIAALKLKGMREELKVLKANQKGSNSPGKTKKAVKRKSDKKLAK